MHRLSINRSFINEKGFTLIELLITIAIIGILAAVSIGSYVGVTRKAVRSEAYTNLVSLKLLEDQFFADNADYTVSANGTVAIQALPLDFRPATGANFTYEIVHDDEILSAAGYTTAVPPTWQATGGAPPCFSAIAWGIAGTRAANDIFTIDCNNVRNF